MSQTPQAANYRPATEIDALMPDIADPVAAADFPQTILRYRNDRAAADVGLDGLTDDAWIAHFGRFAPLAGSLPQPLALRYHGHQFRHYNPDIGDGRGFLFAQLRDRQGRLMDLGTKGSGQTPHSRFGDGRLTLKGGVREILATEMLEALGVNTSRTLSIIETGEALERNDEPSPTRGAAMVRLSHSHIRIGTFQRAAFLEDAALLERLTDYALRHLYDEMPGDDPAAQLLGLVVERTADLAASYMAAGFVHGVLNTDNLNVTGESFDYGPWRFLPSYQPGFTAAYFDQTGLYAFARQPEAVFWNLTQLAGCLKLVAEVEPLTDALNGFGPAYIRELRAVFLMRFGVLSLGEAADQRLVDTALALLREGGEGLRWEPMFFDWFGGFASAARALSGPRGKLYQGEAFDAFRFALMEHEPDRIERLEHPMFAAREPEEMLIEEVEAIWAAIDAADDWAPFQAKLARLEAARIAWGFTA